MKKILYATDFSDTSKAAFAFALSMAKENMSDLVLVNVFQGPNIFKYPYNEYTLADEERELKEANEKLYAIYEQNITPEDTYNKVSFAVIKNPSAVKGILDFAQDQEVDLIIMAALGDNMSSEIVFGGITKNIIKKSIIPIITIPPGVGYTGCQNIVFSTNYYEGDILALKEIIRLFSAKAPNITIVHVSEQNEEEDERTELFWRKVRMEIDYPRVKLRILSSDDIYERLSEYLRESDSNLLVMINHEHAGLFYRLFHPDIIKKMEFQGKLPILTFNEFGLSKLREIDMDMQPDHRA